jgi:hypothetical protein
MADNDSKLRALGPAPLIVAMPIVIPYFPLASLHKSECELDVEALEAVQSATISAPNTIAT